MTTLSRITPTGINAVSRADLPALLAQATSDILWVDMTGPSEDDVQMMHEVFHFHPLTIEDTRNHRQRPKIEEYPPYLFVILNPIECQGRETTFHELDIFVGRNFIVTAHTDAQPFLDEVRERIERVAATPHASPGYLLYILMDTVVDGYFPLLDVLEEEIETLGDTILAQPNQQSLNRLFELKRILIDVWRVVWPQREILNNLAHHDLPFLNEEAIQHYLRDVTDHLMWIADMVTTFRDTLTSSIDLYMSSISNRLNIVVNRLTVFTVMIGLMGVVAGFYGMNFAQTWPPFESSWGVPFVLLLMAVIAGTLAYILRRLHWFQ